MLLFRNSVSTVKYFFFFSCGNGANGRKNFCALKSVYCKCVAQITRGTENYSVLTVTAAVPFRSELCVILERGVREREGGRKKEKNTHTRCFAKTPMCRYERVLFATISIVNTLVVICNVCKTYNKTVL